MNILIVNTSFSGGGAARIARQLFGGINKSENNAYFCAGLEENKLALKSKIKIIYKGEKERNKLKNFNNLAGDYMLLYPRSFLEIVKLIYKYKIDVVHVHNIHGGYLGILDIYALSFFRPLVLTMHDMWNFTGYCMHANECEKWKSGCNQCKMLKKKIEGKYNVANIMFWAKKKCFQRKSIYFITPSMWLNNKVKKSFLRKNFVLNIYNGVNFQKFKKLNKNSVRLKYGLEPKRKFILFLATNISDRKKGAFILFEALKQLQNQEEYTLLVVGDGLKLSKEVYDVVEFGYVYNDKKLNEIYAMADVFITPTLEENFPCVVLESMASGTPVIAFNTGGIVEQIDETTGFLVANRDSLTLSKTIDLAFSDENKLEEMSNNGAKKVRESFDEKNMIHEYLELYQRVMR